MTALGAKSQEKLSERKERDILRAATDVFLAQGYLAANMDEIAAAAGVSKATVYKHFGSKKTLFESIIQGRVEALLSPLRIEARPGQSLAQQLTVFAREFVDLILQPSSLALYRVVIFEAFNNAELGRDTYSAGGGALVRHIADFLAAQVKEGRLAIDDPALAAEQFLGSLTGHVQLRALLGVEPTLSPAARARFIAGAVSAFLRAYSSSD
jgi:AcrR family transcriptional regulator